MRAPRRRTRLAAITFALAALVAGCGDDEDSSPTNDAPDAESADVGVEGNGDETHGDQSDQPPPTGEARGTIEMGGEIHELALDESLLQGTQIQCIINPETQDASVGGMVSADGLQFEMLPMIGHWSAVVLMPEGGSWRAGAADPNPESNYTIEVTEGRLVIDGIWGAGDSSEATEEIRVELICPPTEEGTE